MTDPCTSVVVDPVRMAGIWSDRSYLDQGVPYPPEMAAAPTSTPLNTSRRSRRSWFERQPTTSFEIKVESPERKEQEQPVRKKRRESEEPEVLTLTHFTAPPRIGFGKMKPGEIKDRTLLLRNPHEYEQTVKIEKVPEKKNFSVNFKNITVQAGETCPLTITWAPKEEGNFREMILMQVDKSYRLQAYVFGSVVAPPKKKKPRRGGLLSTKVNGPFSVIHTASLSNINRSYSPEKVDKPRVVKKALKGKEKSSGEYKCRSQRLSGNKLKAGRKEENKDEEKKAKDTLEQEKINPTERLELENEFHGDKENEKVSKKKMRRSDTYSNVSVTGLAVPIIHGEIVQGHKCTENTIVTQGQTEKCNFSGFEVIGTPNLSYAKGKKPTIDSLPSFLELEKSDTAEKNNNQGINQDDGSVEVDSLEKSKDKCFESYGQVGEVKLDLEHSFVELKSETIASDIDLKRTHNVNGKNFPNNCGGLDSSAGNQLQGNKLLRNPALIHVNKENSFMDSLDGSPGAVEPPSFLSTDSFAEDAAKYKLRRSTRKSKQCHDVDSHASLVYLNNVNSSRPVISPDTFVKEVSSAKNSVSQEKLSGLERGAQSPEKVLNESIPHDVVIQQLESVKASLHEQSFEKDSYINAVVKKLHQTDDIDRCETVILDKRETFVKKRTSPRFSIPASEVDLRRGTFVAGAKKAKLLEQQQPSEASPRRTTFTVIKKTNLNALKMCPRARSDETPREQRIRTRSQSKKSLDKEDVIKVNDSKLSNTANPTMCEKRQITDNAETFVKAHLRPKTKMKASEDSLDSREASDIEFKTANEIPLDQSGSLSTHCSLTITKSRPSDALLNVNRTGAASMCLFLENHISLLSEMEKQVDSFDENEEDSLEVSQKSGKNSTFEISANKSILLNKSNMKMNSFPATPCQLPDSPNPDHSRRSTHIVEKPKVLDHTRVDRKQLFTGIVDYGDSSEDKTNSLSLTIDNADKNRENCQSNRTSSDYLARISQPDSLRESLETANYEKCKISDKESKTVENMNARNTCSLKVSSKSTEKEKQKENNRDFGQTKEGQEESDQLFFIPLDDKLVKEKVKVKPVNTGPHPFLKKRSNAVVQNEDKIQSKRAKSDSDNMLARRLPQVDRQRQTNERVTRSRLKTTGSASERLDHQVLKPKGSLKGVAQSKLILMKKTKTALPKHPLPFAAKNMYYDERWMEKQERGFVNWLNFILTPAEEYQSNEVKVKVDAGKLAVDVAKGNIKLAPSNEVLSFRAYSAHRKLNRLRKSACRLFQSEENIKVIQKLEAEVESKRLRVRKDKMMHADLGVKQKILDMLLSYNPLWLRIGLETIYGEVLPLQSNSDVLGLSRFILTRLLNSPEIAEEYAHPTVPHLYRDGYAEMVAQHTLKKFMMLVYFLDKAKTGRLIEHNPCLFCKDSEFKASKDFLLQFSRDYLAGEGDITRHLSYLGYKVTYTQTALDEFDFAVTKLAVDLRDGLRLARVMEFLGKKPELAKTLRVPAISRLQKIHNVDVVFKTLEEQGIQTDKVSSRDIVDGHREKTLQLLWTVILHYQVEVLLNEEQLKEEIGILQKSLKVKNQLQKLLSYHQKPPRESGEPDLHTQNPRLNLLLKWCRTVCAFYNIKIENFTVSFSDGRALCYIVHHYHPGLLPAEAIQSETTVTHMEDMEKKTQQQLTGSFNDSCNSSAAFGDVEDPEVFELLLSNEKENFKVLFEKVKELGGVPLMLKWSDMSNTIPDEKVVVTYLLYLCARLLDIRHESRAARVIQLAWRKCRLRKMEKVLQDKNKAARVIQAMVRKYLACKRLARQESSAVCIQRIWRGYQGRKLVKKLREEKAFAEQEQAVLTLQRSIKQYLHRRRYLQMKESIILLQACCRGYLHRQKLSSAAVTIQKWVRGHQVRKQLQQQRNSVVLIQAHVRAYLVRRQLQNLHRSACIIQMAYRAHKVRNAQQMEFCRMKKAAVTIQRQFRAYLIRKHFLKVKGSVIKIQSVFKSVSERKKFCNRKTAVLVLQKHMRRFIITKQHQAEYQSMRKAAILIQATWKMVRERRNFRTAKKSATKIQSAFRSHLQRKFLKIVKKAVVLIQRQWRAVHLGRQERMKYVALKDSAVKIQSVFRGWMERKKFQDTRQRIILVQACVRAHQQRLRFQTLKQATVVIQRKWQAELLSRQCAARFQRTRHVVILLQSNVRMVLQRSKYNNIRRATVLVQSFIRMHLQKQKYKKIKESVLVLQERFRARLEGQKCRLQYLKALGAVITIQSAYKGYCVRKELETKKQAARILQCHVRGFLQRQKYIKLKKAAVTCQRRYRARLEGRKCRQKFMVCVGAAITIQAVYRGYSVRKQMEQKQKAAAKFKAHVRGYFQRRYFIRLKTAVISCQRYYRNKLEGKQQRSKYQRMKSAAVTIQSTYRQYKCRKQFFLDRSRLVKLQSCVRRYQARNRFLKIKAAAIMIQTRLRETLVARRQKSEYESLKKAAILGQATWRMKMQRREFVRVREAVVKIQSVCRMMHEQKSFRKLKSAAVTVQKYYKAKLLADKCRQDFLYIKGAAITIQALVRGHLIRKDLKQKNKAACIIQSHYKSYREKSKYAKVKQMTVFCQRLFRAKLVRKKVQHDYKTIKKGITALQAVVRGHSARSKYLKLRKSAIIVQSYFRGNKTRSDLKKLSQAALVVQRRFRANQVAKQQRSKFLSVQRATMKIQSLFRMIKTRKEYQQTIQSVVKLQSFVRMVCVRKSYLKKKECAIKIQQWFRGQLETKRLEYQLLVSKGAAITIQATVRGFLARRWYHKTLAARRVQSVYRGYRERKKYQSVRKSAILVQSVVRSYLTRKMLKDLQSRHRAAILIQQKWLATRRAKKEHSDYLTLKYAVSVCQSAYRSRLALVEARQNFLKCKQAAIVVQASVRGYLVRKMLKTQNSAAILIQAVFRSHVERKYFLKLRKAVLDCQARFRARYLGRKQRTYFLKLRKCVVELQAIRRGTVCRKDYVQKKTAAVTIQSCLRGYFTRKKLAHTSQAVVVLQRHWRATLLCRQQVLEYQKLRKTTVMVQAVCRGRKARLLFSQMKAAVKIQSWVRMVQARKRCRNLLQAAVRIQARLRTWRTRKEFLFLREQRQKEREMYLSRVAMVARVSLAAVRIQRCYRTYMVTKVAKERLHSVILLQRWVRAKLVRLQYLQTRDRICRLQVAVRAWLSRRQTAAKVIQRVAKKWFANKNVRHENKAAIKIQALWRGYTLRRKSKSKRLTLVRQRVEEANAAATEDKKLGNRTSSALDYLLRYKHMSSVLDALKHLDVSTRLSPVCCEKMIEVNAVGVLYQLMNSCNRSLPHMEIIKYTVSILLNLAKYEKTRHAVHSEEGGIQTIVELMQVYREKKGDIFPKACTLLGILALDNTCKMTLLKDKKLVERLRSIQSLTVRKHKLEENQRITRARMNATFNTTLSVRSPVKRHKIKPDWSLHRDKLSDFENPLKAINFVLGNLGISTK